MLSLVLFSEFFSNLFFILDLIILYLIEAIFDFLLDKIDFFISR